MAVFTYDETGRLSFVDASAPNNQGGAGRAGRPSAPTASSSTLATPAATPSASLARRPAPPRPDSGIVPGRPATPRAPRPARRARLPPSRSRDLQPSGLARGELPVLRRRWRRPGRVARLVAREHVERGGGVADRPGQHAVGNQELWPASGPSDTRPRAGLSPTSPQQAAGIRIEPPPSLPCAIGTIPAATAAAEPPLEPPGRAVERPTGCWSARSGGARSSAGSPSRASSSCRRSRNRPRAAGAPERVVRRDQFAEQITAHRHRHPGHRRGCP